VQPKRWGQRPRNPAATCQLRPKPPQQEKRGLRIVSSAIPWPRVGAGSRLSPPPHFTSGSARICSSSAKQESHSRKEPYGECGSERRAQHPQEIVDPGCLKARRAIELIDLVRVDHLHRIRCSGRGVDARRRRRARSALGNWRNRPSRSCGRKQTSAPAFVIERLLIRTVSTAAGISRPSAVNDRLKAPLGLWAK
jgi:hypothetical protein